jgi:hypothetical protein
MRPSAAETLWPAARLTKWLAKEYQAVVIDFGLWMIGAFTLSLLVCGCIYTASDIKRR